MKARSRRVYNNKKVLSQKSGKCKEFLPDLTVFLGERYIWFITLVYYIAKTGICPPGANRVSARERRPFPRIGLGRKKEHPNGCSFWCARRESNPHARNEHWHLKPASLPIPPLAQLECSVIIALASGIVNTNFLFSREGGFPAALPYGRPTFTDAAPAHRACRAAPWGACRRTWRRTRGCRQPPVSTTPDPRRAAPSTSPRPRRSPQG